MPLLLLLLLFLHNRRKILLEKEEFLFFSIFLPKLENKLLILNMNKNKIIFFSHKKLKLKNVVSEYMLRKCIFHSILSSTTKKIKKQISKC